MHVRILITVVLSISANLGNAANIEAGKQKSAVCQSCHGPDGNSPSPSFPRLAGQYADYLVQALTDYKNGNRKNAVMAPFAQNLTREDMENLAAYFSTRSNGLITKP